MDSMRNAIKRTLDSTFLNQVANDESVRPWLGGNGPLDLTPIVSNPENLTLCTEYGGWVAHRLETGRYEIHSLFLPAGRTNRLIEQANQALRTLFTETECMEAVTKVPDGNLGAKGLARAGGFQETFRRERSWQAPCGALVGVSYQTLRFDDWARRDSECLIAGQWFHERLEEEKIKAGSALDVHEEDEAHNRAVGASVLMIKAGNHRKAVWIYNRWANFAGYAPISMVNEMPPTFDIVDAVLTINGDDMEVLLCR